MADNKTNVMRVLDQKKIAYKAHSYPHGEDAVDDIDVAVIGLYNMLDSVVVNTELFALSIDPDGLSCAVVDAKAVLQLRGVDGNVADAIVLQLL